MKPAKTKFLLFLMIFFCCIIQKSIAQQNDIQLQITKITKQSRTFQLDANYFIKIKTINGEKRRGKFSILNENLFLSSENDTINFNEVKWIKARKQLRKGQKTIAKIGLVSGVYFSSGTVPAAFIIPAIGGSYVIVLAPVATISAAVIGHRTLAGRKYKLTKWNLEVK